MANTSHRARFAVTVRCLAIASILVWTGCSPKPRHVVRYMPCVDASIVADTGPDATSDVPGPPDSVLVDSHVPAPDVAADTGPPPIAMTATGTFHTMTDLLPVIELSPGFKGKTMPRDSAGLFADLNGDGMLDIVLTDGIDRVFVGLATAPWQWNVAQVFQQSPPLGLTTLAVIDLAGDGKLQIVVGGAHMHLLVRHQDGSWTDEAVARGLVDPQNMALQSVVVADLDEDGLLDLLVTRFACDSTSRPLAFLNRGDGSLQEHAADLGLDDHATQWTTLVTDIDGDRHPDVLTLVEGCEPHGGNAYLHNRGPQQGKRYERLSLLPAFLPQNQENSSPMGGAMTDFDGDGRLDMVLSGIGFRDVQQGSTNIATATEAQLLGSANSATQLLMALADGTFVTRGVQAGITRPLSQTGQTMVSWTVRPMDFDFDGRMDLLVAHAYDWGAFLLSDEGEARPVLFRNQGNGTFTEVSAEFGFPAKHLGRSLAGADVDGDGDVDLLVGGQASQPLLLRNDVVHGGHWLNVRLRGTLSNPWGIGARLSLHTNLKVRVAAAGALSPSHTSELPDVQFTLPDGEVAQTLDVAWPDGYDQTVAISQVDQKLLVQEPPLVQVSSRNVAAAGQILVTARSYAADGKPDLKAVTIELAAGAPGTWTDAQKCVADGTCTRTWLAPAAGFGDATVVVARLGQPWLVRPVLHWHAP